MIVTHARQLLRDNPTDRSLCAALQSLLAYAKGLERCSITVSCPTGRIMLSGEVDSLDAMETAIAVAEVFTGRPVSIDLSVTPRSSVVAGLLSADGYRSSVNDNRL